MQPLFFLYKINLGPKCQVSSRSSIQKAMYRTLRHFLLYCIIKPP